MKIGIMTFWWAQDNYGQILQCYALQKYLRDQGHDAYLIRYDPKQDYTPTPLVKKLFKACNPVKLFSYLKNKVNQKKAIREQQEHPRKFSEFKDTHIIQSKKVYTSYQQLKDDPPQADMYIVGSDQVWNFVLSPLAVYKNIANAYLLNFGLADIKRYAYAASWGTDSISQKYIQFIKPLLKPFNHVTVRESSGIDLCIKCGYELAEKTPDPCFLLSADAYSSLFAEGTNDGNYLLLYMLNNPHEYNLDSIFDWAQKQKLKVQFVSGNNLITNHKKIFPTIQEWLCLIRNASFVITNSFHCSVFSVLYHKQFAVIPLAGRYRGMNTRLDSLFSDLKIEPRYLKKNNFDILKQTYATDSTEQMKKAQTILQSGLL